MTQPPPPPPGPPPADGGQPQPPDPQPAPPVTPTGGAPDAAIAVTTRFMWLAFLLVAFKPKVFVNGHELPPSGWGRQVIPMPAGTHQVHVHVPYFLPPRMGPADHTVQLASGQTAELEYKAPLLTFVKGALGPPPQKYHGMAALIVLLAVLAVLLVCCCGGALLAD